MTDWTDAIFAVVWSDFNISLHPFCSACSTSEIAAKLRFLGIDQPQQLLYGAGVAGFDLGENAGDVGHEE